MDNSSQAILLFLTPRLRYQQIKRECHYCQDAFTFTFTFNNMSTSSDTMVGTEKAPDGKTMIFDATLYPVCGLTNCRILPRLLLLSNHNHHVHYFVAFDCEGKKERKKSRCLTQMYRECGPLLPWQLIRLFYRSWEE